MGHVYTTDGLGSGAHQFPQLVGQDASADQSVAISDGLGGVVWSVGAGQLFGDMHAINNNVATVITVASPIRGDGNAVLIAGHTLIVPGPLITQGVIDTIAFENAGNNELLRVPVSGVYEVSISCSFSGGGGGGGNVYRIGAALNGLEDTNLSAIRRTTSTSDIGAVAISDYVHLSSNDTMQAYVANESAVNNPTVSDLSLTLVLLKAD